MGHHENVRDALRNGALDDRGRDTRLASAGSHVDHGGGARDELRLDAANGFDLVVTKGRSHVAR